MEEKVACVECGTPISRDAAPRRKGLCVLCKAKHRTTNPFSLLYISLMHRVHDSDEGFAGLSEEERLFYSVSLFRNEINNGGFDQFFANSSGSYYEEIEKGLILLNEQQNLNLLRQAKEIAFPHTSVPRNPEIRRSLLPERVHASGEPCEWLKKLNELDRHFYQNADTLTPKLKAFARERGLVSHEEAEDRERSGVEPEG